MKIEAFEAHAMRAFNAPKNIKNRQELEKLSRKNLGYILPLDSPMRENRVDMTAPPRPRTRGSNEFLGLSSLDYFPLFSSDSKYFKNKKQKAKMTIK